MTYKLRDVATAALMIGMLFLLQIGCHFVLQFIDPGPPCFDYDECADLEQAIRER